MRRRANAVPSAWTRERERHEVRPRLRSEALLLHLFASPSNTIYCVVHDGDVYTHGCARARRNTGAARADARAEQRRRGRGVGRSFGQTESAIRGQ